MGSNISFYNFFLVFVPFVLFVVTNPKLAPVRRGGNPGFGGFFFSSSCDRGDDGNDFPDMLRAALHVVQGLPQDTVTGL